MRSSLWLGGALWIASLLIIAVSAGWGSVEPPRDPAEAAAAYRTARYHGLYSGEAMLSSEGWSGVDVEIEVFRSGDRGRWTIVLTNPYVENTQRSYELIMDGINGFTACEVQTLESGIVCVEDDYYLEDLLLTMVYPSELSEPASGLDRVRTQVTRIKSTCFSGWVETPVRLFRRACYGERGELTEWQLLAARCGGIEVCDTLEMAATLIEPLADYRDLAIPYEIIPAAK